MQSAELKDMHVTQAYAASMPALALLLRAFDSAKELKQNPWDVAVGATDLARAGLREIELQRLHSQGLVVCATKSATGGLRLLKTAMFRRNCRFVLTSNGARYAAALLRPAVGFQCDRSGIEFDAMEPRPTVIDRVFPVWVQGTGNLFFKDTLVFHLEPQAIAERQILSGFEQLHWQPVIPNPLIGNGRADYAKRRRNAVHELNKRQQGAAQGAARIRFFSLGQGKDVGWCLEH